MLMIKPFDERAFAIVMSGFSGVECGVPLRIWEDWVKPILKQPYKPGGVLTGENLQKVRTALAKKYKRRLVPTYKERNRKAVGERTMAEDWTQLDKKTWVCDFGKDRHKVVAVGAGAKRQFGAYRNGKYLGSKHPDKTPFTLEEAQKYALNGKVPPPPEERVKMEPPPSPPEPRVVDHQTSKKIRQRLDAAQPSGKQTKFTVIDPTSKFREGSKRHQLFELLKTCNTLEEFKQRGGNSVDFSVYVSSGRIKLDD